MSKKELVDGFPYSDYLCLDIDTFRRSGRWRYVSAVLTWSIGDRKRGAVNYTVWNDRIVLHWQNQEAERFEQSIPLTSVNVNYGTRYFFVCPNCGRRVAKLYAGGNFYCRHCYNLTYESCQRSHDRFHARLGLSDKQYRNFFKVAEYSRKLKDRKRVGARMLRRLNSYIEKSNVRF